MAEISSTLLWNIFRHTRSWLANLARAGEQRKKQSIRALRDVIFASRETAVYIRHLEQGNSPSRKTERDLSLLWTKLGFALHDLGIGGLAKRCQIKGKHWANPDQYDEEFLKKADVSLERMESIARQIEATIM